jgi:protein-tyrosine phosphatase
MKPIRVLFVCLGNICRSPMAEGLFLDLASKAELSDAFHIDSAGTSNYHEGELPDRRMRETARKHGIDLTSRARPLRKRDFREYDYIAAMDRSVLRAILAMKEDDPDCCANIFLMRDYDPEADSQDVPDPYFGGPEGFEDVYHILLRSNTALLKKIMENSLEFRDQSSKFPNAEL